MHRMLVGINGIQRILFGNCSSVENFDIWTVVIMLALVLELSSLLCVCPVCP